MKKPTINFSWPVVLSDFSNNEDKNYEIFSRCKLKVFYKGETADHRYFSDEFADQLIRSLPYTPVVSRYDSESEDFEGHASRQEIFGIVDPCGKITFEEDEEDGKTWCVTDVVLYTERPDQLGELAKKIPGHPHSLELDPKSTKYKINYDDKKHFKNIEFTAGDFVGVSVLGMNQKPAFTGSSFFDENSEFAKKMQLLKDYCERRLEENQHGGEKMNLSEFIKLTWGDISAKVVDAIEKEYQAELYFYPVDFYDDSVVCHVYSLIDGSTTYLKFYYTIDENAVVTLGEVKEVHVVWEEMPKPAPVESSPNASLEDNTASAETDMGQAEPEPSAEPEVGKQIDFDNQTPETTPDPEPVSAASTIENEEGHNSNDQQSNFTGAAASVTNVEDAPLVNEGQQVNESECGHEDKEIESSSSTSFTNSEREEYENLKKAKKVQLVESYRNVLTEEQYNNYISSIDTFSAEDLELDLLKIYKRVNDEANTTSIRGIGRAFTVYAPETNKNTENPLDAFVRKNLKR